jgi:beta-fructofuranosidase
LSAVTSLAPTDFPVVGRYYQPEGRRIGDVIPFYWNGEHHIFFLSYGEEFYYHTPPGARRTPWGHLVSSDLVNWTRLPDAITPSDIEAPDSGSCATGAIFEHAGRFYLYYTGRHFTRQGKKREVICQAFSDDLITWQKDPNNPIAGPDPETYGLENFRDPFVFRNDEAGEFWMLVTADLPGEVRSRKGCLALLASKDLKTWEHRGPFWQSRTRHQHECPDVFKFGDWWYMFYSDRRTTYRYSRSPNGPWMAPAVPSLDDRWFYAAKTSGDENRRLLFAWLATKVPQTDSGNYEWGGSLACRELRQNPDGTLYAVVPAEHRSARQLSRVTITAPTDEAEISGNAVTIRSPYGFAMAVAGDVPADAQVQVKISPAANTRAFGLILRSDAEGAIGYMLRFDPAQGTMSIGTMDKLREPQNLVSQPWQPPVSGPVEVTVTFSGSVIDAFATHGSSVIGRFHEHRGTRLVLWVEDGEAAFDDVSVFDPLD